MVYMPLTLFFSNTGMLFSKTEEVHLLVVSYIRRQQSSEARSFAKQKLNNCLLLLLFCFQGVREAPIPIMAPGQNGNLHHTGPRSEIKKTIKSSKLKKKKVFKGLIRKGSFRLTQSKKKASEKKQNSK